jgi:hypothetical protein
MSRIAFSLLVALALPLGAAAYTQPKDVRKDRAALRDDLRDARRVEQLLSEFRRARRVHDRRAQARIEARVAAALDEELREARRETGRAAAEVHEDRLKVRQDHQEGMWDAEHQDPPETRGNVRALQEDRRDLMREAEYRDRVRAIRGEWRDLRGVRRPPAMERKEALLEELLRLSRYEIRADAHELREDQTKLHQGR